MVLFEKAAYSDIEALISRLDQHALQKHNPEVCILNTQCPDSEIFCDQSRSSFLIQKHALNKTFLIIYDWPVEQGKLIEKRSGSCLTW